MFVATYLVGFNVVNSGIQYVGGKTFDVAGSTSTEAVSLTDLTGGFAAAPAEGDLVVVAWCFDMTSDVDVAVTTGYTEVADLYANDNNDINLGVFLKLMTATPDTTLTVGTSGTAQNQKVGVITVWRGVDPVTPQDVAATTATGTSSALANPPSITPVTPGAIVLAVGGGAHTAGEQTFSSSDLLGFLTEGGADNTLDQTIGLGRIGPWYSGAVNPAAFTFSAADDAAYSWAAVCLALRPK